LTVKLSYEYRDPNYHINADDPSFIFPPNNELLEIKGNLLEIFGQNGTGKSTLLNIIALSMGFVHNVKELRLKPALKEKLQSLEKNTQLQYLLDIETPNPHNFSVNITKQPGRDQVVTINQSRIDAYPLNKFDLIFLTEDDPTKVVTLSKGKLFSHISNIEKKLLDFNSFVSKTQREILAHLGKEEQVKKLTKQITKSKQDLIENQKELLSQEIELSQLNKKNICEINYNVVINEADTRANYKSCKFEHDNISGVNFNDLKLRYEKIGRKIVIERNKLFNVMELAIRDICDKLRFHNISLDYRKLLIADFTELDELEEKLLGANIRPKSENEGKMVTDLIKVFQRYNSHEIIPVFDVPISGVLEKLYYLKDTLFIDNIEPILKTLSKEIKKYERQKITVDDLKHQLSLVENEMNTLGNVRTINENFNKAQSKYVELQRVLKIGKSNIIEQWESLMEVTGNAEHVQKNVYSLNGQITYNQKQIETAELRLSQYEQKDDSTNKYLNKKKQIENLFNKVIDMRQKSSQWTQILINPRKIKEELQITNKHTDFTIADYTKFVNSVGAYLGKQFEPVFFADEYHDITFLDVESSSFKTTKGRVILISDLSQGQSKITSLDSSLKKLDPNKKTIVLIDEIADLDPSNLKKVKKVLTEYFEKGLIIMAVLVRPAKEETSEKVSISAWK
jgi:energy-coupling factor transporter ATP-binding protein EcfA2